MSQARPSQAPPEAAPSGVIASMDIGVVVMGGSGGLAPPTLGRAVEERGFDSLFYAEHTHIPVNIRRADGTPLQSYADTYDPFVALSGAAAVTGTLKLGTGHLPGDPAGPDRSGQGSREPGPALQRAVSVWRRRRVEPPGAGQSRH